jgi:hypothetical protein
MQCRRTGVNIIPFVWFPSVFSDFGEERLDESGITYKIHQNFRKWKRVSDFDTLTAAEGREKFHLIQRFYESIYEELVHGGCPTETQGGVLVSTLKTERDLEREWLWVVEADMVVGDEGVKVSPEDMREGTSRDWWGLECGASI